MTTTTEQTAASEGEHRTGGGAVGDGHIVRARCAGAALAFPVDTVEHVSFLVAVQPVPDGPDYVVGLTRYRGEAVPVLDLAGRLGLTPPEAYTAETPVLWCRAGDRLAGLVLDAVPGVAEVAEAGVRLADAFPAGGPPLRGAVEAEDEMWLLLDVSRIVDFDYAQPTTDLLWDEEMIRHWVQGGTWEAGQAHG